MEQAAPQPEAAGSIKPINRQSIHRICSGQVILDLATAVKELVENALDAGATNIEVRLREYGSALIEVADNGRGVPPADYQALTLKYHTSKIKSFDDLTSVSTYGFRGEALSSLCAVSELSVVTRTAEQAAGVRLEYDHEGLLAGRSPSPRAVGTTVAVKNLFATLPVRHKEFLRNLKREFGRAVGVLQAYALVATASRLIVTHQAGKGSARTTVFTTAAPAPTYEPYVAAAAATAGAGGAASGALPGCLGVVLASAAGASADPRVAAELAALRDNVVAVFGGRVAEALEPLVLPEDPETGMRLAGWVSRAGCGLRGDASRQFFFLNGRPVDLPKAARVLNESFKSLSSPGAAAASCRPMAVLAVRLAAGEVDVNVTPDKRRVFMAAEDRLVALLQQALTDLWEHSRCTFTVNQPFFQGSGTAGPAAAAVGGVGTGSSGGGSVLVPGGVARRGGVRQQQLNVLRGPAAAAAARKATGADEGDGGADHGEQGSGEVDAQEPAVDTRAAKRARLLSSQPREADDGDGNGGGGGGGSPGADSSAVLEPSPRPSTGVAAAAPAAARRAGPATGAPFRHPFLSMLSGGAAAAGGGKGRGREQPADVTMAAEVTADAAAIASAGLEEKPAERGGQRRSCRSAGGYAAAAAAAVRDRVADGGGAAAEVEGGDATAGRQDDVEMAEAEAGAARRPFDAGGKGGQQQQQEVQTQTPEQEQLDTGDGAGVAAEHASEGVPQAMAEPGQDWDYQQQRQQLKPQPDIKMEGAGGGVTASPLSPRNGGGGADGRGAGAGAASPAAAVLRLQPGQLAAQTAARVRHLQAAQERRRCRQQEANGGGAGAGAAPRFTSASLQEDGVAGSAGGGVTAAAEEEGAGGGGGRGGMRAEREAAAERELERVFRKQHFREMKVLGQFNLGFILARHGPDVFIVDQHAAAEKTTFERLQRSVVLTRQPLLAPMPLPAGLLLPVDQLLIREHIDVFRRNGFDFVERRRDGRIVSLPSSSSGSSRRTAAPPAARDGAPPGTSAGAGNGASGGCNDGDNGGIAAFTANGQQLQQQFQPGKVKEMAVAEVDLKSSSRGVSEETVMMAAAEPAAGGKRDCREGAGDGEGWAPDEEGQEGGGPGGGLDDSAVVHGKNLYDDAYGDVYDSGGELLLSAVPVSRATGQLGMEDVVELVGMLRAGDGGEGGFRAAADADAARQRAWEEELRPSRIRAMLASRACRSSVMVGRPLSRDEMRRLLDGLAELRQPWNCPHGRPTMRHVCVLPGGQPGALSPA